MQQTSGPFKGEVHLPVPSAMQMEHCMHSVAETRCHRHTVACPAALLCMQHLCVGRGFDTAWSRMKGGGPWSIDDFALYSDGVLRGLIAIGVGHKMVVVLRICASPCVPATRCL